MCDSPAASLVRTRALVFGASGFLGRAVTSALLARGATVGVAVREPQRLPARLRASIAFTATVDAESADQLHGAVAQFAPSVAFVLSGYGVARHERDPVQMRRVNVDLVTEAARAMAALDRGDWSGIRLVHAGSALEYGPLSHAPDEAVTAAPDTEYGRSKLAATEAVRTLAKAARQPFVTARLFTVFGAGERPGRLFPTLVAARAGTAPVALSHGEQRRDFAYAADVAEALLDLACASGRAASAAEAPFEHGVVNVASGRLHRVRDFATAAARQLGIPTERLRFGAVPQLAEETPHLPVPIARLDQAIGRALPHDLDDALCRAIAALGEGVDG